MKYMVHSVIGKSIYAKNVKICLILKEVEGKNIMTDNYNKYKETAEKRNDWLWRYHDKIKAVNNLLKVKRYNFTKIFGQYPYKPNWWSYNWNLRIAQKHYSKLISENKIIPKHLAMGVVKTYSYLIRRRNRGNVRGTIDSFL